MTLPIAPDAPGWRRRPGTGSCDLFRDGASDVTLRPRGYGSPGPALATSMKSGRHRALQFQCRAHPTPVLSNESSYTCPSTSAARPLRCANSAIAFAWCVLLTASAADVSGDDPCGPGHRDDLTCRSGGDPAGGRLFKATNVPLGKAVAAKRAEARAELKRRAPRCGTDEGGPPHQVGPRSSRTCGRR